jgi:antitoxin MazE
MGNASQKALLGLQLDILIFPALHSPGFPQRRLTNGHNVITLFGMKTKIVRIGNSQGVRIPKAFVEQCHLRGEIDMLVKDHTLILRPANQPRQNWKEAFAKMAKSRDDGLLDVENEIPTSWEKKEWEWK